MFDAQLIKRHNRAFVGRAGVVLTIIARFEIECLICPSRVSLKHVHGLIDAVDRHGKQAIYHLDLIRDEIAQPGVRESEFRVGRRLWAFLHQRLDRAVVELQFDQWKGIAGETMNLTEITGSK